jgi:hypothetical protein
VRHSSLGESCCNCSGPLLALGRKSRQRNNFVRYLGYNRRAEHVVAMPVLDEVDGASQGIKVP